MLLLIVFFPLFGAFCAGVFGRFIGKHGTSIITIISLTLSLCYTIIFFTIQEKFTIFSLYQWCTLGNFVVPIEFLFDNVTFIMLIVVLSISLIVHIYSTQYLA